MDCNAKSRGEITPKLQTQRQHSEYCICDAVKQDTHLVALMGLQQIVQPAGMQCLGCDVDGRAAYPDRPGQQTQRGSYDACRAQVGSFGLRHPLRQRRPPRRPQLRG